MDATCTHVVATESREGTKRRDIKEMRYCPTIVYGFCVRIICPNKKQKTNPASTTAFIARMVKLIMFFVWQNDLLLSLLSCTMVTTTRARTPRKKTRLITLSANMNSNKGLFGLLQTSRRLVVLLGCAGNRHGWSNRICGPLGPVSDLHGRWQRHPHAHVSAPVFWLPDTINAVVLLAQPHQLRGPQTPPVRSPGDTYSVHIAPTLYAAAEGKAVVDMVPFERRCGGVAPRRAVRGCP